MKRISKVFLLVHPNFDYLYSITHNEPRTENELELELRSRWDNLASELVNDESALLICFSALTWFKIRDHFEKYYRNDFMLDLMNKYLSEEIRRNSHYSNILKDRFILMDGKDLPLTKEIYSVMELRGLTLDKSISMVSFGEYYDICVFKWLYSLRKQLVEEGINIESSIRDIRLSNHDVDEELRLKTLHYFSSTGLGSPL